MKKIVALLICISALTSAEVKIVLREPLRFKEIRSGAIYNEMALAEGIVEITAEEEDFGKGVKLEIPEFAFIGNGKRWIKIDRLTFEKEKFLISEEKHLIKIYGVMSRKELEDKNKVDITEGSYEGSFSLAYSLYKKSDVNYEKK